MLRLKNESALSSLLTLFLLNEIEILHQFVECQN